MSLHIFYFQRNSRFSITLLGEIIEIEIGTREFINTFNMKHPSWLYFGFEALHPAQISWIFMNTSFFVTVLFSVSRNFPTHQYPVISIVTSHEKLWLFGEDHTCEIRLNMMVRIAPKPNFNDEFCQFRNSRLKKGFSEKRFRR